MPQIRPITDLRNTTEISELCHARREPVFITKNGYGDLVVMSMEYYESLVGGPKADTNTSAPDKEETAIYDDSLREELIEGKPFLLPRSLDANEAIVAGNLLVMFGNYVEGRSVKVFHETFPLVLSPENRFFPDLFVMSPEKVQRDACYGTPDLVVEILSPQTAQNDRGVKKTAYAKAGVQEYWIVDIASHFLEVYYLQEGPYVATIFIDPSVEGREENAPTEFICNTFPDLIVHLEDVFDGLLDFT